MLHRYIALLVSELNVSIQLPASYKDKNILCRRLRKDEPTEMPTRVVVRYKHNHQEESAAALSKRPLLKETIARLRELFKGGLSMKEAMGVLGEEAEGTEISIAEKARIGADRSKMPDERAVRW